MSQIFTEKVADFFFFRKRARVIGREERDYESEPNRLN